MPRKPKQHRARGDLPGEYVKRTLVTIPLQTLEPGGRRAEDHYIVMTRRLDGAWSVTVEHGGEVFTMPDRVVKQIGRHQRAIIKAGRQDRGRDAWERQGALAQAEEGA